MKIGGDHDKRLGGSLGTLRGAEVFGKLSPGFGLPFPQEIP